ncbi:MAG: response regulator transcription factor [Bacteroidia bacterium]|nr:response regulator transcription factor [Bacteroidia bacterium]MBP9688699.1 response regulator transcription factor [Bacteroidia bacterium]
MIKIAIVDDKQPNRVSLQEKLAFTSNVKILFTAANGTEYLAEMKKCKELPDIVLMDIDMPIMNGIEAVNVSAELYPNTKCLMLTVFDDDEKIFEAIKAGAIGYLLKDESIDSIVNAMNEVIEYGGSPMSPRIARKALQILSGAKIEVQKKQESILTEREMEILKGLVEGLDYKGVADKLFISPHTVRTHITNIYQKLHVSRKTQAVMLAVKNKWFMMF